MIVVVSIVLFYFTGEDLERAVKDLFAKESQEYLISRETQSWLTPHEPWQADSGEESVYEESNEGSENKLADSEQESAEEKRAETGGPGADQQKQSEVITPTDSPPVKTPPPVEREEETKKEETVTVDKAAGPGEEQKEADNKEPAVKEKDAVKKESVSLSGKEQQFLNLLNNARRSHNLPELTVSGQLTRVARAKSKDMADNNYFSHTSPVYGDLEEMLRRFKIKYSYAGENLAMDSCGNISGAHQGLMNSAGHRSNILNRNYTHIGIGIVERSDGYHYYTQIFVAE